MTVHIPKGAFAPLPSTPLVAHLRWTPHPEVRADAAAFLLDANGQVQEAAGIVCYDHARSACGSVHYACKSPRPPPRP